MPHNQTVGLQLDPDTERLLEAIRQQQGLDSLDQAAEFLARRRMRRAARKAAGPRAMYPVR
ncbi:hypothetical protein [Salinicola aestuarinus]|uniref:hypothetical protein n=1 Tax=Salinicola aestuarinus TaxID=1949082 RepID=UPI000DA16077|nr:hypothetical protein [Salinicola aestuarinus]